MLKWPCQSADWHQYFIIIDLQAAAYPLDTLPSPFKVQMERLHCPQPSVLSIKGDQGKSLSHEDPWK